MVDQISLFEKINTQLIALFCFFDLAPFFRAKKPLKDSPS